MDGSAPWLSTRKLEAIPGLPDFGYRLRFDHTFTTKCRPFLLPRLQQMPSLFGMGLRYARMWLEASLTGKKLFIDNFNMCPWKPIYGVPIGGIGCGTIGRGFRGEFCRFQMIPGLYRYHIVDADQFSVCIRKKGQTIYHQVLSPHTPKGHCLSSWNWGFPANQGIYHALYPRSWTVYHIPEHNVRLCCRQISPVIPHDYRDSCLPCAVFVWDVYNTGSEDLDISIMFTFKNGQGEKEDKLGGVTTSDFSHFGTSGQRVTGVAIRQMLNGMLCTYSIGAMEQAGVHVTYRKAFDPLSNGHEIWQDVGYDGDLDSFEVGGEEPTQQGEEIACAVCCRFSVPKNGTKTVEFGLTWDMPVIHFSDTGLKYTRRYTRYYGMSGEAFRDLLHYSLNNYHIWEEKIDNWQKPILENENLPSWYKSALFNELYYISDGGTVWIDPLMQKNGYQLPQGDRSSPPPHLSEYGQFAYLEGHEYRMYNTYDVHHYASFALLMLWPKLQLLLQYDIASFIPVEQGRPVRHCMSGKADMAKCKNCVPHDIGDPNGEPWQEVNAYRIHPTSEWKDLNTKFILQVYRDYVYTGDKQYLQDMFPYVKLILENCLRWDVDDDGIIDNAGFADQTYDAWPVTGASAYCGGMWLAAVKVYTEMAKQLCQEDERQFCRILEKGKQSFQDKLWNGSYYNYDSSKSSHHDSIMADQLAGPWYLKACHVADDSVFPKENIKKSCQSIYEHNVLPFAGGTMGAINGMRPSGKKDLTSIQSDEFWVGVCYSLAATMIQEGLLNEGWQTAYGAYHTCYEDYGLAFQTPEAYFDDGRYRSLGYMRPLAIWSIQYALEQHHPHLIRPQPKKSH